MEKKCFCAIALTILLTVFAFGGCSETDSSKTSEKPITLRFASFLPPKDVLSGVLEDWAKALEERTQGRVKIVFYHAQSLVKIPEMVDAVAAGTADMAFLNTVPFPDRLPLSQVMGMPIMRYSKSEDAARTWWALYEKYSELQKEYTALGLKALFVGMPGPNQIEGRVPIQKLEDLKGLKAAVETREESKAFELFGAAPVTLQGSDKYTAMERSVVETSSQNYNGSNIWKTYQIAGCITENVDISYRVCPVVINLEKYNRLPADVKAVFDEVTDGKYWTQRCGQANDQSNEKCREEIAAYHQQHNNPGIFTLPDEEKAKFRELVMPINLDWAQAMEAKGLPGQAILKDVQAWAAGQDG